MMTEDLLDDASDVVSVGETCTRIVSFTPVQIADFARLTGDTNPLHSDAQAAAASRHGRIIASGQQTTSQMIGLAASHFSRADDGIRRELLCLNFNFALKAPVFADEPVHLSWTVRTMDWNGPLNGWLVQVEGRALSGERACVIARGTLLVKKPLA
jgi:acyl dehydratase